MAFLTWWYGRGWMDQVHALRRRVTNIGGMFSVPILLRTMFSPWKQTVIIPRRDQSMSDKIQAMIGNQVSRFVGFGVRLLVLITALICIMVVGTISILGILVWPFLPLLPLAMLFVSLVGWDARI